MTYQKKPFSNYFLCLDGRVIFWSCDDCTEHLEEGGKKDGRFVAEGIIQVIEEVGPQNVLHVCLDGATVNDSAREMIEAKYKHITTSHCLMHLVNLLISDVVDECDEFQEMLRQHNDIINFCSNHHLIYAQVQVRRRCLLFYYAFF